MLQQLTTAVWHHSKKKADLILDEISLIEMKFERKFCAVKIGPRHLEISKDGFWCPQIKISEDDKLISLQKQVGFWGTSSEFTLGSHNFIARTKQGALFNITYSSEGVDILTYSLDTLKSKPRIIFQITSFNMSEPTLLLLLAVGFYSIRNVAREALANDFLITSVA